jgi:hypothetical protein
MSKSITFNGSNNSAYLYDDSVEITVREDRIIIGEVSSPELIIMDMNSNNATLHENVTAPDDWFGNKYKFDGSDWSENPEWSDPVQTRIAELEAELAELQS